MEIISDQILSVFFKLETHLNTLLNPAEKWIARIMHSTVPGLVTTWTSTLTSIKSPYTVQLPLTNVTHMAFLIMSYLSIVFMGKFFMTYLIQTKFTVKYYALVHNLLLTLLSAFMCLETLRQAYLGNYSLFGNGLQTPEQGGTGMAKIIAVFYCSKILEFNDTFIMVLKKNFHQITFLHLYHHASIFAIWWLVSVWAPTGDAYYSAALNSFIHVIMYGYYFLSAMGVKQVSLVKKYITTAQMTQFVSMMVQATYNIINAYYLRPTSSSDGYPVALSQLLWVYMVSMLALFGNFYVQDRKRDTARRQLLKQNNNKKVQ